MDYFELECAVEHWAEEKGILAKATPMAQALKTLEETTELCTAINSDDSEEIIDAMGDIMVTLIIQAKMQSVTLEECLESAYNVISKRTGKMVDGLFVKDEVPHNVSNRYSIEDIEKCIEHWNTGLCKVEKEHIERFLNDIKDQDKKVFC